MTYKGYEGIARFDEEAGMFTGEVINTRDVITFQGKSVAELKRAFEASVEDYLEFCASRGEEPDKPFSGMFTVRMPPELHRRVALEASRKGKSLNAYVVGRLKASRTAPA
ncbi:MAG: type II toxin-antitoxin system HicB family antitoxin [Bryobacteraceae bacterium]|jgi:predicted HicB family RNase H-like nuclease